jgi:NTP pyrophosphatase (non-canonical NTP hydrolase)
VSSRIRNAGYSANTGVLLQAYENWLVRDVENTPELTVRGADFDRVLHAAIGLAGESGEILDLVKKGLFGRVVDAERDKFVKEMGDVLWYFVLLMNAKGITLNEILTVNVEKLCDRYGKAGFEVAGVYIGGNTEICGVCGEQKGHCDD